MSSESNALNANFEQLQFSNHNSEPPSFQEVESLIEIDFDHELDYGLFIDSVVSTTETNENNDTSASTEVLEEVNQLKFCNHKHCNQLDLKTLASGFYEMGTSERIEATRSMLFVLSSPSGMNEIMQECTINTRKRKRNELVSVESCSSDTPKISNTTCFVLRGRRVCRETFCKVVGLSGATVRRNATEIIECKTLHKYENRLGESRKGKWGVQRVIVKAFLISVANDYGIECPRGRGSKDETPIRLLPSHFTKQKLYDMYLTKWNDLSNAVVILINRYTCPDEAITYSVFIRYWASDFSLLRIASKGSDFCDTCTTLKDTIKSFDAQDVRGKAAFKALNEHMECAKAEFRLYKSFIQKARENTNVDIHHFIFDFAEKVLLPKLQKQPGQLHFITGLKFDLFGVACSNEKNTDIYGLVEGYWPGEKTANTVLSMLHHSITLRVASHGNKKILVLHADNCVGQNKNHFVIFYILWRVMVGLNDEVTLHFLIPGHTKNVCDGSFGHVKRNLLKNDVVDPKDMMNVVKGSSKSNNCIAGSQISWRNWKEILKKYFIAPSTFRITENYVFRAKKEHPGILFVRSLSTSTEERCYNFNNIDASPVSLHDLQDASFNMQWPLLDEVPSKHHGNRKQYLTVNIIEKYYANNNEVKSSFFQSGV